jgi:hypothetical protein
MKGPIATPLDAALDDVDRALGAGVWYAALVVALTIPEVCAALESPDGTGGSTRYKAWYDTHMAPAYPRLTADDCYSIRCGVLHQGRMGRPGMQYARVLFTVPNARRMFFHNNIMNDALNLDLVTFCNDLTAGAQRWYAGKQTDEVVARNAPNLVQLRAGGLAPYMVGMPLIT